MWGWVPFALSAFLFGTVTTLTVLFSRRLLYDEGGAPYDDVAFYVLPNWADSTSWPLALVAALHCTMCLLLVLLHESRWILLRRLFMVASAGQIVAFFCQVWTVMPAPNEHVGSGLTAGHPAAFPMYPCLITVASAYAFNGTPYITTRLLVFVGGVSSVVLGLCYHTIYSVDTVCMIAAAFATYFILEWNARSPGAVRRSGWLNEWFEADYLELCDKKKREAMAAAAEGKTFEMHHVLPTPPLGGAPETLAISDPELRMAVLINTTYSEADKQWKPFWNFIISISICAAIGMLNAAAAAFANQQRPLGRMPMQDRLFESIPFDIPGTVVTLWLTASILATGFDAIFLHPLPLTALRRATSIWATAFMLRCFTVSSTFVADPYISCAARVHPDSNTCGDCVFSGHAVSYLCLATSICSFRDSKVLPWLVYGAAGFGMATMILARYHYSRDVFTGAMVYFFARYLLTTTIFSRPDRIERHGVLFWYELDWIVARERITFGYPKVQPTVREGEVTPLIGRVEPDNGLGRMAAHADSGFQAMEPVDTHAPTTLSGMFDPRWFLRLVRPVSEAQSEWFKSLFGSSTVQPVRTTYPGTYSPPGYGAHLW